MLEKVRRKMVRTEEEFVFVHDVSDTKVDSSEDDDQRLLNTIQHRDDEHQNRLRIHHAIINHRWCIQLCKI
jgi:hypothetical protein